MSKFGETSDHRLNDEIGKDGEKESQEESQVEIEVKDQEKAEHYRQIAEQGFADGEYNYGVCLEFGVGIEKNCELAVSWYRMAAAKAYAPAVFRLGVCFQDGIGVSSDLTEAVRFFTEAATLGHAEAQFQLGVCYDAGNGVTSDPTLAVSWYHRAALQNHTEAQYYLGSCYDFGRGVEKESEAAALLWYKKAAEKDHVLGQYHTGRILMEHSNKSSRPLEERKELLSEAMFWLRLAAEEEDANAQCLLALCCQQHSKFKRKEQRRQRQEERTDVFTPPMLSSETKDDMETEALHWLERAVAQGQAEAQYHLAHILLPSKVVSLSSYFKVDRSEDENDATSGVEPISPSTRRLSLEDFALPQTQRALALLRASANQDFAFAQSDLGWLLLMHLPETPQENAASKQSSFFPFSLFIF